MAWLTEVQQHTGVAFKVRWREPGTRAPRAKHFHDRAAAEAFLAEMDEAFPKRKPGPTVARPRAATALRDRIAASVKEDENGCWIWQRGVTNCGYAKMTVPGGRTMSAHRVAYQAFKGAIPQGLVIDHLCRVRHCVNPDHLEPVTYQENVRRSPIHFARFRAQGQCMKGHILADVGLASGGRYGRCAECARASRRTYRAKQRAAQAVTA